MVYYGGDDYWKNNRSDIKIFYNEEDIEKNYTLFCTYKNELKIDGIENITINTIIDNPIEFTSKNVNTIPTLIITDNYGYEIGRYEGKNNILNNI